MKKLYKILVDGKSCHGGDMEWSLPTKGKPGEWHTVKGDLEICQSGLHLTTERFKWYKLGCTVYEADAKGIAGWEDDKCVARSVRLLRTVPHPKWWVETVKWINTLKDISWLKPDGKPKKEWKLFKTWAAAMDAAGAGAAAGDAAGAAAGAAARAAAGAAARAAARDAAWDAAWAAAGDAARAAAWDAARDAAMDAAAAWAAAGDAARAAALYAQGLIVADLKLEPRHRTNIKKRMEVWQKGYGLLCDVDGVLYVYEKL